MPARPAVSTVIFGLSCPATIDAPATDHSNAGFTAAGPPVTLSSKARGSPALTAGGPEISNVAQPGGLGEMRVAKSAGGAGWLAVAATSASQSSLRPWKRWYCFLP